MHARGMSRASFTIAGTVDSTSIPCCAKLPVVLDDGEIKLHLYRKVSSSCHKCGRRGRSWTYRSPCKKYNLHVACVKDMLVENWQGFMGGKSARKFDTRIPSLKNTVLAQNKRKSKAKKGWEMAGLALQFVVSAVLGDPTTLIAGVIGSMISKA
ncbi:CYSTEINE/HISTIDINE-RICH C1 DOMAIN FAMILY PROTEIN [Salix koriyanagi]|uniref:CYSTEINE/HISTIDINE-RICH C1 DOMAIN FAMILY PROTEIN n=1 Tax=Salix koriyanagi TaxID=2511006 RepID=A0A9Q0UYU2_9ROSI|nr:CYSTEINE/HISTIDINE-RICH C1 DOMAIN FAMILY PROTEIN [Salix koriyanagi]